MNIDVNFVTMQQKLKKGLDIHKGTKHKDKSCELEGGDNSSKSESRGPHPASGSQGI